MCQASNISLPKSNPRGQLPCPSCRRGWHHTGSSKFSTCHLCVSSKGKGGTTPVWQKAQELLLK